MSKQNSAKLKKKEIKTSLIESIEKTLKKLNNDTALEKVKKTIVNAAEKVSKKYVRKLKKQKDAEPRKTRKASSSLALTKRNKNYTKSIKGKPGKDAIQEAIKL